MCLAVPGRVISIDKANPELVMAKVNFSGVMKDICVQWVPEVKEGDYVLAHVGMALNILDEGEALETIKLIRELVEFQENEQVDDE
jgi:hydrogenase expression/formation protein HypC